MTLTWSLPAGITLSCAAVVAIWLSKTVRAEITLSAPADGGTPLDPVRIEAAGANEFQIRASMEDGKGS